MIYTASWLFKLVAFFLLGIAVRRRKIGKSVCYIVSISQKFHMISLNTVALDVIPYSLRAIFQTSSEYQIISRVLSGVLLSLLVYDFCEVYRLGGQAQIRSFETEQKTLPKDEMSVNSSPVTKDKLGGDQEELDHAAMILKLRKNMTIVNFCTNDLKENN